MICLECRNEGERSRVTDLGTFSTLMFTDSFYDEDGVRHFHDPNRKSTSYECSRGHRWSVDRFTPCPADGCDYGATLSV